MISRDLPPWRAVYRQARRWNKIGVFENVVRDLRTVLRAAQSRGLRPTTAIIDSCTVRSTPESGGRAGYDGYKRIGVFAAHDETKYPIDR